MLEVAALARCVWEEVWPADNEALLAAVLHRQFHNYAAPSGWRDGLDGAVAVVHQLNGAFSDSNDHQPGGVVAVTPFSAPTSSTPPRYWAMAGMDKDATVDKVVFR